jgi:hypothetical protein
MDQGTDQIAKSRHLDPQSLVEMMIEDVKTAIKKAKAVIKDTNVEIKKAKVASDFNASSPSFGGLLISLAVRTCALTVVVDVDDRDGKDFVLGSYHQIRIRAIS